MASTKAIEAILDQALAYCRRYSESERAGALRTWSNVFALTESAALAEAVTAWIENLEEEAPRAQVLPTPKALNRYMTRGAHAPAPDRPPARAFTRPSREYVTAHTQAARRISNLVGPTVVSLDDALEGLDPAPPHRHKAPTIDTDSGDVALFGNEDCRRCAWDLEHDLDAANRRRQIEEILSALPTPVEESRPCRCDGSGMVDTLDSVAALRSLDVLPREVYPCSQCRPDEFEAWRRGAYKPERI